jgi:exodeoxyribonuclease VII small subunit
MTTEELPFEEALSRLESLVDRLEHGDLALEEALTAFEEGVRLTRRCAAQLEHAERRIDELVEAGGEWLRRPLEATLDGAADDAPDGALNEGVEDEA